MYKRIIIGLGCIVLLSAGEAGCQSDPLPAAQKNVQAEKAAAAASSVVFTDNQEIDNLKRRLEMNAKPGGLQYIMLVNQMGQPILYETVEGKVTSSNKRLTRPDAVERRDAGGTNGGSAYQVRSSPSDTGTWGSSDGYIFYWNTSGAYRQWSGPYLLSDQPFRLTQQPLVVEVGRQAGVP